MFQGYRRRLLYILATISVINHHLRHYSPTYQTSNHGMLHQEWQHVPNDHANMLPLTQGCRIRKSYHSGPCQATASLVDGMTNSDIRQVTDQKVFDVFLDKKNLPSASHVSCPLLAVKTLGYKLSAAQARRIQCCAFCDIAACLNSPHKAAWTIC